jgi:hypothetical protein
MKKDTQEFTDYMLICGIVSQLEPAEQGAVNELALQIEQIVKANGERGTVALALAGAKIQAEQA